MAVDYIINQACVVKDVLTAPGLIALTKDRTRAMTIFETLRKQGTSEAEARATSFTVEVPTPQGITRRTRVISETLEATRRLDELGSSCHGCVVSSGQRFGCFNTINYPLSAQADKWLADLAANAVKTGGPAMEPLQVTLQHKLKGGVVPGMREAGPQFFDLRKPLEVVVRRGFLGKKIVNTDQLFYLLLGVGTMQRPHAWMMLQFSNGLTFHSKAPAPGGPGEVAGPSWDSDGKPQWVTFHLPEQASDDRTIRGLKGYFRAIFVAWTHEKDLTIDL